MRCLSLFSGIGAHDLGLSWAGVEIAGQVEIDPYCAAVLERHWPGLPRWGDVRDVRADDVLARCGRIDLITGGFPCQDISVAGKGAGLAGARSGLFFEMARVIGEVRPRWVLLENVPALKARGYERVESELEALGYALWPSVAGAWACGAPHKRDRVWIVGRLAEPEGERPERGWAARRRRAGSADGGATELADPRHDERGGFAATGRDEGPPCAESASCGASELADVQREGLAQRVVQPGISGRAERADAGQDAQLGRVEHTSGPGLRAGGESESGWPDARCPILRWPARPGEAQHEWEAPRLVYTTKRGDGQLAAEQQGRDTAAGSSVTGELGDTSPARRVRTDELENGGEGQRAGRGSDAATTDALHGRQDSGPTQPGVGDATARATRRLAGFARRNALKALGNANPWVVPYIIGTWLMHHERARRGR